MHSFAGQMRRRTGCLWAESCFIIQSIMESLCWTIHLWGTGAMCLDDSPSMLWLPFKSDQLFNPLARKWKSSNWTGKNCKMVHQIWSPWQCRRLVSPLQCYLMRVLKDHGYLWKSGLAVILLITELCRYSKMSRALHRIWEINS